MYLMSTYRILYHNVLVAKSFFHFSDYILFSVQSVYSKVYAVFTVCSIYTVYIQYIFLNDLENKKG